jgi:hypothetical protein
MRTLNATGPITKLHVLFLALTLAASALQASADEMVDMELDDLLALEIFDLGVTGIHHTHEKGEWMVGYGFMHMNMSGNRDGTTDQSIDDVFALGYAVAPTDMTMDMHMLHFMYGITDDVTVMMMMPFLQKSMDHVRGMDGVQFTTDTGGIGDIELSVLYNVLRWKKHRLTTTVGLSFPSGSIDETDQVPGMMMMPPSTVDLPYPMQLGTGSAGFLLGLTYVGQAPGWQWGGHASGKIWMHDNDRSYRVGDSYVLTAWGARKLTSWSSASLRMDFDHWFNYEGADPALNPMLVPTADPDLRAGRRLDIVVGLSFVKNDGPLAGTRLSVEGGAPIYQSLDGPQLKTTWMVGTTLEKTF